MKFFLDTANLDEIRDAAEMGVLDGVTTNPSLIAKEGAKFGPRIIEICEIVQGPVSAEVTSRDAESMCRQGRELAKLRPFVVVKTPTTKERLKAARSLIKDGIKVNSTLCFSPSQALSIQAAGNACLGPVAG